MGVNIDYYPLTDYVPTAEVNSGSAGIDIILFLNMDPSHMTLAVC